MQLPLFEPKSHWSPPEISGLPSWAGAHRVSIDAETCDPELTKLGIGVRRGGYVAGWSFTLELRSGERAGPFYLPIAHEGGDNLDPVAVRRYLCDNSRKFTGYVVGANLDYDLDYAVEYGMDFSRAAGFHDIQIADPLIYELHDSYSLDAIGERYGISSKFEDIIREAVDVFDLVPKAKRKSRRAWKSFIHKLPARFVGEYAQMDSLSPLMILEKQLKILKQRDQMEVFRLESDLLPVLVKMRRRGVAIDFDRLERIEKWTLEQEQEAISLVKRETGYDIGLGNVWKPDALAPALHEIGFPVDRTPKTGQISIKNELLDSFEHPVAVSIRRARKVNRLRTTFAESIRRYECNGRIHPTYNQIARENESGDQKGVRYGRLSCVDPNLQQQPSPERDFEIASEWRKIYVPDFGLWGCLDYSQQEPRWTTHFAEITGQPRASEAAERYRNDPSTDNHDLMTRLIHGEDKIDRLIAENPKLYKTLRGYAKMIFLGLCYGEGGAKLCHDLRLPTDWVVVRGRGRQREMIRFEHEYQARTEQMRGGGYVREVAGSEGQKILDEFDREAPYVRKLAKQASDTARDRGYVKTLLGRRLHFPKRDDGSYDWIHKALNRIIQGCSADQTKKAVVDMDRANVYLQLQVHDEVDGSFETVAQAKEAAALMSDAIADLRVPFKVDVEMGESWGELKAA